MAGFFGPQQWALLMMDEAGENLHYAIAIGETQETLRDLPPVKVGQGFAGRVAAQGTSMIVPDVSLRSGVRRVCAAASGVADPVDCLPAHPFQGQRCWA